MGSYKRAKKSGKNTKKPQLYDLTQGMPRAEGTGEKSELEVFQAVQPVPEAPPVPSGIPVSVPAPPQGIQYRPKPMRLQAAHLTPVAPQVSAAPQVALPPLTPVAPQVPVAPQIPVAPQVSAAPQVTLPPPVSFTPQEPALPPLAPVIAPVPVSIPHESPETDFAEVRPARKPDAGMPASQGKRLKSRPERRTEKHGRKKDGRSDLAKVYDYVNGKKTLDLPEGVQGATKALPQKKKKKTYVPVKEGKGKTRPATLKAERLRRRKQEERLTYMIVACIILFLIASGFLLRILWNYRRTALEYADLTDTYVRTETEAATEGTTDEELPYPPLSIDFPGLFALNSDLVAWIHVPGCDISYPVVQTTDNDYYLNHTFLKTISSGGAVFLDYGDHADFSDFNTFIYGHNMQDGSMFGTLHRLWQDEALADNEPYYYIYLRNGSVRKYRIVSYYRDDGDSDSYVRVSDNTQKEAYVNMIMEKSSVNAAMSPSTASQTLSPDDSLVTLSTCHGGVNSGQRFLVHGKLVGVY